MKRVDVDAMLDEMSAQQVLGWFAFLAVRHERRLQAEQAARDRADGWDDEEIFW